MAVHVAATVTFILMVPMMLSKAHNHHDLHGGVKMGVKTVYCDDGKTNLTLDWDDSTDSDYACQQDHHFSSSGKKATHYCQKELLDPIHTCMNTKIEYEDRIPMSGPHRPLWPVYGEYLYAPPQRWVHSLEHGTIVMLYHPCADKNDVKKLRNVVTGCLYRHIITPFKKLSKERPFALVAWGCKIEMGYPDVEEAEKFIKKYAKQAPEKNSDNGQYDYGLVTPATYVTDKDDTILCPETKYISENDLRSLVYSLDDILDSNEDTRY